MVTGSVTSLETPCMVKVPVTSYLSCALGRDLRALEGDLRELLDVEEVGRAQVLVAARLVGVDAGGLDRELDRGRLRLGGVAVDRAREVVEAAADLGDAKWRTENDDLGVRLVDGVGLGAAGPAASASRERR